MTPAPAPAQALPPGSPVTIDAVMRLLRDNALVKFRLDIENESTIAADESQEKQDRTQLVAEITKMVETWSPLIAGAPQMAPLACALIQFAVRAFPAGRSLETVIDETCDKILEMAGQPKPPPQPSPDELIKLKGTVAKTQAEIQKAQIGVQAVQVKAQADAAKTQAEMAQTGMEHQSNQQQAGTDAALAAQKAHLDAATLIMKAELEKQRFDNTVAKQNQQLKDSSK